MIKTKRTLEDELEEVENNSSSDDYVPPPDELASEKKHRLPAVVDDSAATSQPSRGDQVESDDIVKPAAEAADNKTKTANGDDGKEQDVGNTVFENATPINAGVSDADDLEIN